MADRKFLRKRLCTILKQVCLLLVLFSAFNSADAQTVYFPGTDQWTQQSSYQQPGQRTGGAMAYDGAGHTFLFGGYYHDQQYQYYLQDTWAWDGNQWTVPNNNPAPGPRTSAAMAFDGAGHVLLFGGWYLPNFLNDTWYWDGAKWTQMSPANSPSARANAGMGFDAAGHVVLFGGYNTSFLQDTWIWSYDGTNWNWVKQSPSTSPSGRAYHAMGSDSQGRVLLFGGETSDSPFKGLNDTWAWDGANWKQLSPANSPSARGSSALAPDGYGQFVLFGGYDGTGWVNDSWSWDGGNWRKLSPANSPSGRSAAALGFDGSGRVVMFGGYDGANYLSDTWTLEGQRSVNVGSVNVGSNNTTTVTFNVASAVTLASSVSILTQGAPSLDFTVSGTPTCTGVQAAGNTCTVDIAFAPQAPGVRMGAVHLSDSTGNLLSTTFVSGTGVAPVAAIYPGTQGTAVSGLSTPVSVALDAAGDIFIGNSGNGQVVKVPAGGGAQTTVASSIGDPAGIAVDGAGNVFISDRKNNAVIEVPAGCTNSSCQLTLGIGLSNPAGLAVNGAGDLFVADSGNKRVVKLKAGCSGCQQTVLQNLTVQAVAIDGAGNLQTTDQSGIAVDAAGDLFISYGTGVYETQAGCSSSCHFQVGPAGAVAINGLGDIFITQSATNSLLQIASGSQTPSLSFESTLVTMQSPDSPKSVTLQNVGNAALTGSLALAPNSFAQMAGSGTPGDCSSSFSLDGGDRCNLSVGFTPQSAGAITGSAAFVDNTLNDTNAVQSVALSGTGQATVNVTIDSSPTGQSFTVTGSGCSAGSYTTPTTFQWGPNASCNVSVSTPPAGQGTEYVFAGWSDGNGSNPRTFSTPAVDTTYVAGFSQWYQLTTLANPTDGGSVSGSGFYPAFSTVSVTATPNTGWQFASWTGSVGTRGCPPTGATTCVRVTGVMTVTANFSLATTTSVAAVSGQYGSSATLSATVGPPGSTFSGQLQFSVNGTNVGSPISVTGAGTYTLAYTLTQSVGSTNTVSAALSSSEAGVTGSSGSNSLSTTAAPLTITASSPTMIIGAPVPTITPSYSGFVNNENASVLNPGPTCSTTVTSSSPVGTYTGAATCKGAVDPNYSISYVAGTVKVTYGITILSNQVSPNSSGSTVPLKVQLKNYKGTNLSSSSIVLTITGMSPALPPGASPPSGTFTFVSKADGGPMYQYNVKTTNYPKATYTVYFTVSGDPVVHSVNFVIG